MTARTSAPVHPAARRRRFWRAATVVPAVLTAIAGVSVAVAISSSGRAHTTPDTLASYADGDPIGVVDTMRHVSGGMVLGGWSYDPNLKTAPVRVFASVDGKRVSNVIADASRSDVATAHPSAGALHGFRWTVTVPEGVHTVCVGANNRGVGADIVLKCRTGNFDYGPVGALEAVTKVPGHLHVRGWAVDRDAITSPIQVTVSIDGVSHTLLAGAPRPTQTAIPPAAGPDHGYHATFAASQGTHQVCVTGINVGNGSNNVLGCKTVVLDDNPISRIQAIGISGDRVRVGGWSYDNDNPKTALAEQVKIDGVTHNLIADRPNPAVAALDEAAGADHGFYLAVPVTEGTHSVCVVTKNIGYGSDVVHACRKVTLTFTPTAVLSTLTATRTGATVTGWTADPDTTAPIRARITVDGITVDTVRAKGTGATHSGHDFTDALTLKSGSHTVCVIGLNVRYGTTNSTPSCRTITLALSPIGRFTSLARANGSDNLTVTGWALDPDTKNPITVAITLDGTAISTVRAAGARSDVGAAYPSEGPDHGLSVVVPADDGEHTVCLTAANVGGGSDTAIGCKLIIAEHPVAPSAARAVAASAGYGGATITWSAPVSDGGAPWSGYTVTASPGGASVVVGATSTTATVTGLKSKTRYTFSVVATNVAGPSVAAASAAVTTQASPPAQRTPAPVSTSRYIRNVRGSSPTDLAAMRAEGVSDAKNNPSGHAYLVLLDIGGQDEYDGGVILSAGVRFVSYSDLVKDIEAYEAGYHSAQKASAPVTIAMGTNSDIDVSRSSGKSWARKMVNPLATYAKNYIGMTIAGANDIEPGFRASYSQTKSWLGGYLAATDSPFIFNGSADGCAYSYTNGSCNNGWTMRGLNYLTVGAAPIRMLNLPQIYNTTMAAQWKYISLTGIVNGEPKINFAGPLTEYTACAQAGGCGSISAHSAWQTLWNDLQSDSRLKVASLPYSTDLRIDR